MKTRLVILCLLWHIVPQANAQTKQPIDSLKQVLATWNRQGNSYTKDTVLATIHYQLGKAYMKQTSKDSALFYLQEAYMQTKAKNLYKKTIQILAALGNQYSFNSLYPISCDYYLEGLVTAQKVKDFKMEGLFYRYLADDNLHMRNYTISENYYNKAIKLAYQYDTRHRYLLYLNNLASLYYEKGEYDKALKQYLFCRKENENINDTAIDSWTSTGIGLVYGAKGDFKKALDFHKQSLALDSLNAETLKFIGENYLRMKDYTKASDFLTKASQANQNNYDSGTTASIAYLFYRLYKETHNPEMGLYYHENYTNDLLKNDSLKNEQLSQRFQLVLDKARNEIKQRETEQNLADEFRKRNYLIVFLIFLFILTGTIAYNNRRINQQKIQLETVKKQLIATNKSLDLSNAVLEVRVTERTNELQHANEELLRKNREILESLMKGQKIERKRIAAELHDNLGSLISGINFQIQAIDLSGLPESQRRIFERIRRLVQEAYADVRFISHNMMPSKFEEVGLKVALQKLAHEVAQTCKLDVILDIDTIPAIDNLIAFEIYSACSEIINNILKHAKASQIHIKSSVELTGWNLKVTDDGIGFSTTSTGKGLSNIQERIQSIGGSASIESGNEGTKWLFSFGIVVFQEK